MSSLKLAIKIWLIITACLILPLLLIGLPTMIAERNFTKQLTQSLPIKTELLASDSTTERLGGSGSRGMEFLSVVLVQSELSLHQLKDYYQYYSFAFALPDSRRFWKRDDDHAATLPSPYPPVEARVHLQIEKVNDLPVETGFSTDEWDIVFFSELSVEDFSNLYFIAIWDGTYPFL